MIIQDVADSARLAVSMFFVGYAKEQFGARSGDDDKLSSGFGVRRILLPLLCRLCATVMAMVISVDVDASEREFGVGFSRYSTADPMGGKMRYSLWYPTKVRNGVVAVGPFEFPGTADAEPAAGQFGLVVLSHGSGSADLGHWDTAIAFSQGGLHHRCAGASPEQLLRRHRRRPAHRPGRPSASALRRHRRASGSSRPGRVESTPRRLEPSAFLPAAIRSSPPWARSRGTPEPLDHCERHAEDDPYCCIINRLGGAKRAARARAYAEPAQRTHDGRLCAAVIADPFAAPFSRCDSEGAAAGDAAVLAAGSGRRAQGGVPRLPSGSPTEPTRTTFPIPRISSCPVRTTSASTPPCPNPSAGAWPAPKASNRAAFQDAMSRRAILHDSMNRRIVSFLREAFVACSS